MDIQYLNTIDTITWKLTGVIKSPWHRHKQTLFYLLSLFLWDILEMEGNTGMYGQMRGIHIDHFVSINNRRIYSMFT